MTSNYDIEKAEGVRTMRGIRNALIISVLLFWLPLIVLLTWWVG